MLTVDVAAIVLSVVALACSWRTARSARLVQRELDTLEGLALEEERRAWDERPAGDAFDFSALVEDPGELYSNPMAKHHRAAVERLRSDVERGLLASDATHDFPADRPR